MSLESDLVAYLLADSAIAQLIADEAANEGRIYPLRRPKGQKNLDAIVYQVISAAPAANLEQGDTDGGAGELEVARVSLNLWSATHDGAAELARLVHARMKTGNASVRAVRISRQSDVDQDTGEHRRILDYSVWHSPQ